MAATIYTDIITPSSETQLRACVAEAFNSKTAVYPLGGRTSENYGLPAKQSGIGLSTRGLTQCIDYPARDMTITVETGITMQALAKQLASERQQLPVDVPLPDQATLGGVVATNWNGPRRFGYGQLRDFVIGIRAVNGRGVAFQGGGRVVKNVAGYDFCKLLTGSMGSLAVITQVTLKVRPLAESVKLLAIPLKSLTQVEQWWQAVDCSEAQPTAWELVSGASWQKTFAAMSPANNHTWFGLLRLEGTGAETHWLEKSHRELCGGQQLACETLDDSLATSAWMTIRDWSQESSSPLVLQINVPRSAIFPVMQRLRETMSDCELMAHAGNGVIVVKYPQLPAGGISRLVIGELQPLAAAHQGRVITLSNPSGSELTWLSMWGHPAAMELTRSVKQQFDPAGILNPGRFVV